MNVTQKNWFEKSFQEDYLWLYAHRSDREATAQVRTAIRNLPFKPGQKVLDIACGAGRHMLAFARKGAIVTGVDLSTPLLRIAREKFRDSRYRAVLRRGDMRHLTYREKFDGATLWFTSFGYFATIADDQRVLTGMAAALKSGGWFWVDLPNPVFLENNLVPVSKRTSRGPHGPAEVVERRIIRGHRVIKTIEVSDAGGHRVYRESVRLYRPERIGSMLRRAGLATDGILGDYDGTALTATSPRQIWLGHKSPVARAKKKS